MPDDVEDGPTQAEIAAAEATLAAAQAKYQEPNNGPSEAEVASAQSTLDDLLSGTSNAAASP